MKVTTIGKQLLKSALTSIELYDDIVELRRTSKLALGVLQGKHGAQNILANQRAFKARDTRIPMAPVHVSIEPANICDMGCPVCETGAGIMARPRGFMTFDNFKIILDKVVDHTNTLFYYFMGEPFLNKEWYPMLRYAKDQGVPFITTCTNGHFVDPVQVVDCGIDELSFQIGGLTQQSHETYRVRGKLDVELENCRATIAERNRRGLKTPRVNLGFIVMKHNEHEVNDFLALAEAMGVDEAIIIEPTVRTVAQGHQYLPNDDKYWLFNRADFERGRLTPKLLTDNECSWIYHSIVITWNGDIVPCCRDTQGKFVMGNLLDQSFEEIWNGDNFQNFRERVFTNQGGISICKLCSGYGMPTLYDKE